MVHYDTSTQGTWLVVNDGSARVSAAGQDVDVAASFQTVVENGAPPEPPRPATRDEIGTRFPLVDDLTNAALADGYVLPIRPTPTPQESPGTTPPPTQPPTPSSTPTPVAGGPTPTVTPEQTRPAPTRTPTPTPTATPTASVVVPVITNTPTLTPTVTP